MANLTEGTFQFERGALPGLRALALKGLALGSLGRSESVLQPLSASLQQLKIVNSKLRRFPPGLFRNLRNLTTLTIAHNAALRSPALPEGIFADLGGSLTRLTLEDNGLQQVNN